jgi:hypothetical protein
LKKIILLLMLIAAPLTVRAEEPVLDQPHWSFEMKAGRFAPSLADWELHYGKRDMPEYALSLAYKLLRQVDIGIEGGLAKTRGPATAALHGSQAGNVTYEIYPVNAFVLFRGVARDNQLVIPYIGGGFTKILYREAVEGQGSTHGSANGYHARGGLQFLLDGADRDAANAMYLDYGVMHTYFFVEAEYTVAKVKEVSTDLGGTAYLAGFLFEF